MDASLVEAAYAGDTATLRLLLQEDRLLLRRQVTAHLSDDGPVHIAASLGHSDFVRVILAHNPELAHCLCLAQDSDGFLPIHTAAIRGRTAVLSELLDACPESEKVLTSEGDSPLHLAVRSNSFETVQFLLNRMADENDELLNLQDVEGNTILHLAVVRKQLQTVKLLLGRRDINVNATNLKGDTVLDVLQHSPSQRGVLLLGELIRAAGGRTAEEEGKSQPQQQHQQQRPLPNDGRATTAGVASKRIPANICPRLKSEAGLSEDDWKERYTNNPGTLMLVATLIATVTFQAGLNPPGGVKQNDDSSAASPFTSADDIEFLSGFLPWHVGQAILGDQLGFFLIFNSIGLFASLSIILLLMCCVPSQQKLVMEILRWILWLAVSSTALAFTFAATLIFNYSLITEILLCSWFGLFGIFMVWIGYRAMRLLLRIGGCWKRKIIDG